MRISSFGLVVAVVLSGTIGLQAAHACSCVKYHAWPAWPTDGMTNVPLDATLVIGASRAEDLAYALTDAAGNAIALEKVRTLDAGEECAFKDYVFLRPEAELAPNTRYTLTPAFPEAEAHAPPLVSAATFTTGNEHRIEPTMVATLWLFGEQTEKGRLMQLFASVASDRPAFIVARGEKLVVERQVAARHSGEPIALPLGVVPCADVEVVDVDGTTRHRANICEPQRCARAETLTGNSCGGHLSGRSWGDWQRVPEGCDSMPAAGCSVASRTSWPGTIFLLFVGLIALGRFGIYLASDR